MFPVTYYRVCDRCGAIHTVSADDAQPFACSGACTSTAAWEFAKYGKALDMQRQVRERLAQ